MKKTYHIVTRAARESAAVIEEFCQTNGQILLPIVNLIQNASQVVETVIHEIGHQMLEQILVLSAEQVAGARTPGKASGDVRHHGSQPGCCPTGGSQSKSETTPVAPQDRRRSEGACLRSPATGPSLVAVVLGRYLPGSHRRIWLLTLAVRFRRRTSFTQPANRDGTGDRS